MRVETLAVDENQQNTSQESISDSANGIGSFTTKDRKNIEKEAHMSPQKSAEIVSKRLSGPVLMSL